MDPITGMASAAASSQTDAQVGNLRMMALNPNKKMSDTKMREVADQFESMIYRVMIKEMRKTVPTEDGLFGESQDMQMYMDIVDDNLSQQLSQDNNLGVDQLIYEELKEKNKKLALPGESKDSPEFKRLHNGHSGEHPEFTPLHPSTEKFLELHKPTRMMELKPKEGGFLPLGDHPRVSSDRIEHK